MDNTRKNADERREANKAEIAELQKVLQDQLADEEADRLMEDQKPEFLTALTHKLAERILRKSNARDND
jgi:hypothetical protein